MGEASFGDQHPHAIRHVERTISLLLSGTEAACAAATIDIHRPLAKRLHGTDILSPPFP